MKKHVLLTASFGLLILAASIAGCSKRVDANKPLDQVQAEVQNMNLKQLESNARAYAKEITSKNSEVQKATQQIKTINPTEIFSEKAKGLKDQISKLGSEVSALSQRYEVYAKKFQELGGNLENIKVS